MLNKPKDFHMVAVNSCYIQGKDLANAWYFHALKSLLYQDERLIINKYARKFRFIVKSPSLSRPLGPRYKNIHSTILIIWLSHDIWHPQSGKTRLLLTLLALSTSPAMPVANSMNSICAVVHYFLSLALPYCVLAC